MGKLVGSARVSTRQQDAGRQVSALLGAGVRCDDLYVDMECLEAVCHVRSSTRS